MDNEVFLEEEGLNSRMVAYFSHDLIYQLIIFQAVILLIIFSNIWITRRIRHHSPPAVFPMVSVLIPARNEERNIASCVRSLLAQDYPSFEVLVLDDQSSDGTKCILEEITSAHPELIFLEGEPPADELLGKNWACSQLARRARGDLLLFTDADTCHRKNMLTNVVTSFMGEKADLLTGFPRQDVHTWGERLLVPFFSWVLFCFVPLALGYRLDISVLSSAVGQLMLFRRDAYLAIGGHESVGASMVDDLSLVRKIKSARLNWRVAHIADLVSCRMYHTSREAVEGFTKNLFAVFGYRLIPFLLAFIWLLVMFWEPLIVLVMIGFGQVSPALAGALVVCLAFSELLWLIPYANIGIPMGLAFLYPFTILANVGVACRSMVHSLRGQVKWKDRVIRRARLRWL